MKHLLHFDQANYDSRVTQAESETQRLQDVYNALSEDFQGLTYKDLRSLVSSQGKNTMELFMRGRETDLNGFEINPNAVQVPKGIQLKVDSFIRDLGGINLSGYDLRECKIVWLGESDVKASCSVYGSAKAKELTDKIETLANQMTGVMQEIGSDSYSPLRNPESWMNFEQGKFIPNYRLLNQYIR